MVAMSVIEENVEGKRKKTCKKADKNPICPYLNVINQNRDDIQVIKNALIGEDMQGGLVAKVNFNSTVNKVLVFFGGATLTAIVGVILSLIFNV